ncbi:MAG: DNA-protecting protein DprA [Planctomycetes bacterium]|nr:DNA-protecting protein DprA [Planctomycetota bacterium]
MDDYLMLALAEGCGPHVVPGLLDPHVPPRELLAAPPGDLPRAVYARLTDPGLRARAARLRERARAAGLRILTPVDPGYPARLRDAPLRPAVLFARCCGEAGLAPERVAVAVVGSRTPTAYGEAAARDFAGVLARAGVTLWSGLAYGIDAIAHAASVDAGTPGVAVLAGGLDRIEPVGNAHLARQLLAVGGSWLSEAPPGRRPGRGHFPRRNRILAHAVDAVLVVEAGLASGSLHTARFAADVGVPVFAVPGPYTSERSRGCHRLIEAGAGIACDPADLLRELGICAGPERGAELDLRGDEAALWHALGAGPRPADLLRRESGLDSQRFLAALLRGCERGLLLRLPGDVVARGGAGSRQQQRLEQLHADDQHDGPQHELA